MNQIKTIFFDFDGVVIDSEPLHAKAKKVILDRFGISYPESIFDDFKGIPDKTFFDYVSKNLDSDRHSSDFLQNSKKMVLDEIINELRLIDGFHEFISRVKQKGIKTAMVSSTSLYSLGLVDKLYNLSGLFDLVITEVDTHRHKPYPDPYLKALEKLPADISSTVVIEDSPNGIIAAKKAGCYVYGLTTSFNATSLREAGADEIVDSFEDLTARIIT